MSDRADVAADRTESFTGLHRALTENLARVLRGKADVIDLAAICLIAEGHLLVEDVPGVGKTSLAKAISASLDVPFGRIQFTPDLLPSDVVGVSVWDRAASRFEFRPGPVFANVVLADEINRASPKTQSALLEAMAESQVTVDGGTHSLGSPFLVIATQNPIEHEGTYPLPESQLDRFLMRISVGYPDRASELEILRGQGEAVDPGDLRPVLTPSQLHGLSAAAQTVHVAEPLLGYIIDLAEASRRHRALAVGMSPRASLALQRVARVRAATRGRTYLVPDDVKALAVPALAHRLLLTPEARVSGVTAPEVVSELLELVPVPAPQAVESA